MKEWSQLNPQTLEIMKEFGEFSPTIKPEDCQVKGYMYDDEGGGKVYLNSNDLREFAKAFEEVAAWLDERKIAST